MNTSLSMADQRTVLWNCLKTTRHLRVYSEPDLGVYDAWNKGISRAKGQVINFLNSDDKWHEVPLEEIKKMFLKSPLLDVLQTDAGLYTLGVDKKMG